MYKIIVAGCGGMSPIWIEMARARKDCQIVALVDPNMDAAHQKKEQYNLKANIYSNMAEALEKENGNLVFDITVPEAHVDTVTRALEAGCHVFGEKPMSDNLEDAEKMVACADRVNREYFVMQNQRYHPQVRALKNFLESKVLGEMGQISANFQLNPHFGGFREEMESPLIADMSIHTFDMARFITGKNPISVYCHEFNPSWSWFDGDASAVCIFEMEEGMVFDYRGSWCANGLNTSWQSQWRVACEKGAVYWDGLDQLYYDIIPRKKREKGWIPSGAEKPTLIPIPPSPMEHTGHVACVEEMFEALWNGTKAQTDCRDNINSIRMVYKAMESSRAKKVMFL